MTERLNTNQVARLLKEDKQLLEEQIRLLKARYEALNRAFSKQEDKVSSLKDVRDMIYSFSYLPSSKKSEEIYARYFSFVSFSTV